MKTLQAGDKFTRLTVKKFSHKDERFRNWWICECDCGEKRVLHTGHLRSGNTKSCGCLATDLRKARRLSKNHSEVTAIILGYKNHAVKRGFKWFLSRSFVESIIKKSCYYCGLPPNNIKKTKNSIGDGLRYSGIDRVDPLKDYTVENTFPCCKRCNIAKNNMTLDEFYSWATRLGEHARSAQWSAEAAQATNTD